jgi:hypothetical protein
MKKALFAGIVIIALLLSLAGIAGAAPPPDNPGKGPPNLDKIVFVHYPKGVLAKGGIPGAPEGKKDNGDSKLWYKYSGLHWGSMPVDYYVTDNEFLTDEFLEAIQDSFATWDLASEPFTVDYMGTTDVLPDTRDLDEFDREIPDFINVVGWKYVDDPNAIAVTYMWYNTLTMELVDVDTALNSSSLFIWWQNSVSGDPDIASWTAGETPYPYYDVDVQNIMTHEAGHWLVLDDLRQKPAGEQTMYGRSTEFELQKRSLESGDEAGIQVIYPNP